MVTVIQIAHVSEYCVYISLIILPQVNLSTSMQVPCMYGIDSCQVNFSYLYVCLIYLFLLCFQPGEILIVPYTDVGWSPYFPLISGLVTEVGGLVSHGELSAS